MKLNLIKSTAAMLAGILSVSAAGAFNVSAVDEESIVILGDSLSCGENSYVKLVEEATAADVQNFSVDGGTTADVLELLQKSEVRSALDGADVIVVNVGIHDIMDPFMEEAQGFMDEFGFEKFGEVFSASLSDYNLTETKLQLYAADLTLAVKSNRWPAKENMLAIGEQLSEYSDAQIVFQNVYNPIDTIENLDELSSKRKSAYESITHVVTTALNESVNAAVTELSGTYGYGIADVQTPFVGNAYRYTNLEDLDVTPTAMGQQVIAEQVLALVGRETGDVNNDGSINAQDAAAVLVYASEIGAGLEGSLNRTALKAADVNGVDGVNAADAAKILAYAAEASAGGTPSWK